MRERLDKSSLRSEFGYDPFTNPKNEIDKFFTSLMEMLQSKYDSGYDSGYNDGFEEAKRMYKSGDYDKAFKDGYDAGFKMGVEVGRITPQQIPNFGEFKIDDFPPKKDPLPVQYTDRTISTTNPTSPVEKIPPKYDKYSFLEGIM